MVGAGVGGSAVAHFLQQHFGPRVQIDVFEKGTVGGRLATISVNKQHYESGAASLHSLSLHMQDFVKQLGECAARARARAWGWGLGQAAIRPFPDSVTRVKARKPCRPSSSSYRWSS